MGHKEEVGVPTRVHTYQIACQSLCVISKELNNEKDHHQLTNGSKLEECQTDKGKVAQEPRLTHKVRASNGFCSMK